MLKIVMPTLLGLEALVASELKKMGVADERIQLRDGQVFVTPNEETREEISRQIARFNVRLSCCERVQLELISQEHVENFDQLFECVKNFDWASWVPRGYSVWVDGGYSRKSKLFGIPTCQRMIKKAIVQSLAQAWHLPLDQNLEEDSDRIALRLEFSFLNDVFSLRADTTGTGLHKRGYRLKAGGAPLKETLAASLVQLTRFRPFGEELLYDPFCGSGTLLIEAARWSISCAPGSKRNFLGERLPWLSPRVFDEAREEVEALKDDSAPDRIFLYGSDSDSQVIRVARENARRAGVKDFIRFEVADACKQDPVRLRQQEGFQFLTALTNPPYGERLLDQEAAHILLQKVGSSFFGNHGLKESLRLHLYTSDQKIEESLGFRADKRRKIYNGMIPCHLYQYFKKEGQKIQVQGSKKWSSRGSGTGRDRERRFDK